LYNVANALALIRGLAEEHGPGVKLIHAECINAIYFDTARMNEKKGEEKH